MRLTLRQQEEKNNLEWFAGDLLKPHNIFPTDEDFQEYLAHSERGIPLTNENNFYRWAKVWRGRTIHELWEDSFYARDGSWPGWYTLLKEENGTLIPRHVAEFISKEIFAGQDRDLIMNCYRELSTIAII